MKEDLWAVAEHIGMVLDEPPRIWVARHEAAHAVLTCWHGFVIGTGGVSISPGQPTCHVRAHREPTWREKSRFSLAGKTAERLWGNSKAQSSDAWLRNIITNLRGPWWRDPAHDDTAALVAIMDAHPSSNESELVHVYRSVESELEELLRRPAVWTSVERVAEALIVSEELDDAAVRNLLHPSICCGAFHNSETRAGGPQGSFF